MSQKIEVRRIVRNVEIASFEAAHEFYGGILGLELAMDHGFIRTYVSREAPLVELSFASQGGSGTPVPDLSIEVADLDAAVEAFRAAGLEFEYGPVSEPWGVRRFYVRDPYGQLVNVLEHEGS